MCPIMLHIPAVVSSIQSDIAVGAQNVALNEKGGAFTGEVYAGQLKDFGLTWAITGHSERREMYGETNEIVGKKTKIAVDAGLNVRACIGEKLEAREGGQLETVLNGQLAALAAELTLVNSCGGVSRAYPCRPSLTPSRVLRYRRTGPRSPLHTSRSGPSEPAMSRRSKLLMKCTMPCAAAWRTCSARMLI